MSADVNQNKTFDSEITQIFSNQNYNLSFYFITKTIEHKIYI